MLSGVIVGALLDGLRGVSIVWVVLYPLLSIKLLSDVSKITGMSMLSYYRNLWPVLLGTTVMGITVLLARTIALPLIHSIPVLLAVEVMVGMLTYFFWIVYLDRKGLEQIRQTMLDLGIAENRLNRWPFIRHSTSS